MRSKAPLALMEQLVMVLVFSLSAAFCLQMFVVSRQISGDNEALSKAVLLAQNTAELLKAGGEDWELVLEKERAQGKFWEETGENLWQCGLDEHWNPAEEAGDQKYRIVIEDQSEDVIEGLGQVEIRVVELETVRETSGDGAEDPETENGQTAHDDVMFRIPVAWQEVDAHE